MSLKCGFAEIDITPRPGAHKIGWLKVIVSDHVLDPLYARAAVLESAGERIGFLQLDTLFVPDALVAEVRRRIAEATGFPGGHVMVCATHNHAGPAVDNCGAVRRDDAYVEMLTGRLVEVFGRAIGGLTDAEIGFGHAFEFDIPHCRRVVMRDGTVKTHGSFADPEALCIEGPVDPEVAVLAARRAGGGELLGALVNFACHPTHHGPDGALSAGYPGVLAAEMTARGCPVTCFLYGAAGDIHFADLARPGPERSMQEIGRRLADDVTEALDGMAFTDQATLVCRSKALRLPFRELTDEQIRGTVRGAQRFVDPTIYDRVIPELVERIRRLGARETEVQVLRVNDVAFAAVGAEYFAELGLRIKQRSWPVHALLVSCANGRLGYVPTREAFARGGYETTFGPSSCLGEAAGDLLADAAVELIGGQDGQ